MARKKQGDEFESLSTQARGHFQMHLRRLGLDNEDHYRRWCHEHGLSSRLAKTGPQREREVALKSREGLEGAFARSRTAQKDPGRMLDLIFSGEVGQSELSPEYRIVAQLISSFGRRHKTESIARFRELFLLAAERTKLISTTSVIAKYPRNAHNAYIGGLAAEAVTSTDAMSMSAPS